MEKKGEGNCSPTIRNSKKTNIFKEAFKMNEKSRNYENKVIEEFINMTNRNKSMKIQGRDVKTLEFNSTIFKKDNLKQKSKEYFEELMRDRTENLGNTHMENKNMTFTQRGFFNTGFSDRKILYSDTQTLENKNIFNKITISRPNNIRSLRNSSKSLARIMPSNVLTSNSLSLINFQNFPSSEVQSENNKLLFETQRLQLMSNKIKSILNIQQGNIENPEKVDKYGVPIKVNRIFPFSKLKLPQKTICLNLNLNVKLNLQVNDTDNENLQKHKIKSRKLSENSNNILFNDKDNKDFEMQKKLTHKEYKFPFHIKKALTPNNPQTKKIPIIKQIQGLAKTSRDSKSRDFLTTNKTTIKNNCNKATIPDLKKSLPDYVRKYYKIAYNLNEEKLNTQKSHNATLNKFYNLNNDKFNRCDNNLSKSKPILTSRADCNIMKLTLKKDKNMANIKISSSSNDNLIKLKNKSNLNINSVSRLKIIKKI
jgi:hypothetical protein